MVVSNDVLREQLSSLLEASDLSDILGDKYEGKVRDCYRRDGVSYLVATDKLSCFDVVLTTLPFKGQILTQLAAEWFHKVSDIVPHHLIDVPDPQVMVVKSAEVVPFEVVVRGYLAGGGWRSYKSSGSVSGHALPEDLGEFSLLPQPLLTPSTKAPKGEHDTPVSEEQIRTSGKVEPRHWDAIREYAMALFARGTVEAKERGLLLADTKYEFGIADGEVILIDEVHTLDSSRYWIESTYADRLSEGKAPEMLDKEPVRRWLAAQGYMGEGEMPVFTDENRIEFSRHYIDSFTRLTGREFEAEAEMVKERIRRNLVRYMR